MKVGEVEEITFALSRFKGIMGKLRHPTDVSHPSTLMPKSGVARPDRGRIPHSQHDNGVAKCIPTTSM